MVFFSRYYNNRMDFYDVGSQFDGIDSFLVFLLILLGLFGATVCIAALLIYPGVPFSLTDEILSLMYENAPSHSITIKIFLRMVKWSLRVALLGALLASTAYVMLISHISGAVNALADAVENRAVSDNEQHTIA